MHSHTCKASSHSGSALRFAAYKFSSAKRFLQSASQAGSGNIMVTLNQILLNFSSFVVGFINFFSTSHRLQRLSSFSSKPNSKWEWRLQLQVQWSFFTKCYSSALLTVSKTTDRGTDRRDKSLGWVQPILKQLIAFLRSSVCFWMRPPIRLVF